MVVTYCHNDTIIGVYKSTVFFLWHDPSRQELLFFSDIKLDRVILQPLRGIWYLATHVSQVL